MGKNVIPNIIRENNDNLSVGKNARMFQDAVAEMEDPRTRHCNYPLVEILFIALCANMCGGVSYQDFATFGESQIMWFKEFFKLENGIPSHDTFRRVFQLIKSDVFEALYRQLSDSFGLSDERKHLAIDGKTSRGCYDTKGHPLLHTVTVYDTVNGVAFAQKATKTEDGKETGECNTIPLLVQSINIEGSIVTVDAGGCYMEVIEAIVEGGADYVITLKENQPKLYQQAETIFAEAAEKNFEGVESYSTYSKGHGREETRNYYSVPMPEIPELREKWGSSLNSLTMRISTRVEKGVAKTSIHYFISSLTCDRIKEIGDSIRGHWKIENNLHWTLDVCFKEDANRTRRGYGASNLSLLRKLALALLQKIKGKNTIPNLIFKAAVDPNFRTNLVKRFLMR